MKHAALLALALALGTAGATSLPNTKEFNSPVSLTTPVGGMTLEAALSSISRAVGFTLVARDLPATQVKLNFTKRPYREVFETLVNVYGADNVDYASLGNKLIVVAPTPILARTVAAVTGKPLSVNSAAVTPVPSPAPGLPITEAAQPAEPMTVQVYAVRSDPNALISVVTPFYPQAKLVAFGQTLLVNATESDHLTIKKLIDSLDATTIKPETPAAAPAATVRKTYPLMGSAADITTLLKTYYPDLRLSVAESAKLIIADIPESSVKDFEGLLASVNVAAAPTAPAEELPFASFPMVTPSQAIIDTMRLLVPGADIRYIPETGMVVVRGTPEQIVRATTALNMINVAPSSQFEAAANPNAVTQRVYRLSYAKASDLLARIKSFSGTTAAAKPTVNTPAAAAAIATAAAMGSTGGASGDVPVSATPSLIVEADERTNAIVAMGTTKQLDDLRKTIDLLDVPVSQVRLRIRIEQIQGGNSNDLGLAWKAGIGGVSVGADASGLSVGYAPLGTLNPINLEVKLNALASKGASKTLMNTQFLTQDNQLTKFNAGGSILLPVTAPATTGSTGTTPSTTSDYKSYDYGLGVELQPRIGADGNIELALKTDIGQKPADGPRNSVLFEKQTLSTKISIKQGETIVLGGLLTTEERNTSAGVPLLSQIPVIGALFRKTTNSTSTSDLLFVLSAEVINPPVQRSATTSTDVPRDANSGAQTTTIGGGK